MAIKGSLREASLPDVLQLLSMGQKTGCLSVTDRSNFGSIYFESGRIIYAMIVNRPDRLGDLLVRNGEIDRDQLEAAIAEQQSRPGVRFGEILIERGAITQEVLERYVRIQIEEAVYFLFTWSQGSFYFEADERPEEGVTFVSLNPENLLLEGARRVDEWSLIEQKIPSFDMVFARDETSVVAAETELTQEQRKVLPLLDGNRSVRQVADESGLVDFEAGKAIFGLLQAGFVRAAGTKRTGAEGDVAPTRADEHRNLGVAFYRTGMFEEAIREFRRVAELQPEDLEARFVLGLIALRKGDDAMAVRFFKNVAQRGGRSAPIFGGMALALERLGRLDDARLATEEALRLESGSARLQLSLAIVLLKAKRVAEAREAFARYRDTLGDQSLPPAAYYVFAVAAEAVVGRSDAALRLGEEGLELYPGCAPLLLHLGAIWERRGEIAVAETMYRRAVEEDANLAQAHKALGDALYHKDAIDEAAAEYRAAIELAPKLGDDIYVKLGSIYYKKQERDAAVELWRRALELNPENDAARTSLELIEKKAAR